MSDEPGFGREQCSTVTEADLYNMLSARVRRLEQTVLALQERIAVLEGAEDAHDAAEGSHMTMDEAVRIMGRPGKQP